MRGAIAYEWRRITTVRSTYWFSGLSIGLSAVIALIVVLAFRNPTFSSTGIQNYLQASTMVVTAGASLVLLPVLSAPFCAVIGAMSFGHEYRYGTIKQSLTAVPRRVTLFTAKLIVLGGWLIALMSVIIVVDLLIGALFMHSFRLSGDSVRPIVNFALYGLAFGIVGFGLAAILRNLAGALVVVLVYPFVVEPLGYNILRVVNQGSLSRFTNLFPAAAGRRTIYSPYESFANPFTAADDVTAHVWGLTASSLVFWCGVLIVVAGALTLFLKRDA